MNFQLISAVLKHAWAIHPESAESYLPMIGSVLNGTPIELEFDPFELEIVKASGGTAPVQMSEVSNIDDEGAVLRMPVHGPLMKRDQLCGPVGMQTMGNILKQADANPNIKGVLLDIDSPGGTADGTAELASTVKNMKTPVTAYVDGMAASAAYWIASAADSIVASDRSTVGSIGTMLSFADLQPAYERLGVNFHRVVSDLTPDKGDLFEKVRRGDYEQYKKEVLNPLANDFIKAARENRTSLTDGQVTGKTFFANDVTGTMVDAIGTRETALEMMSTEKQKPKQNTNQNNTKMQAQFEHLNKVLGVESLEQSDEGTFLNQDQLEAINAALTPETPKEKQEPQKPAEKQEPPAEDPRDQELAQLKAKIAEIEAKNAEIEAKNADLEAQLDQPGAESAKATPKSDPGKSDGVRLVTDDKKDFIENMQAVAEAYMQDITSKF